MNDGSSRFQLQSVAFFGRTLAEYLQMLALDQEGLRGLKILDVASGPGSFLAEALAMGLDATGCDPMYNGDPEAIVAQGKADIDACREQIRRNPGVLVYADIGRAAMTTAATLRTQGVIRCSWPDDLDDECSSATMQAMASGSHFRALDHRGQLTSRKLSASTRTTGVLEVCQHAGVKFPSSVTTAEILSGARPRVPRTSAVPRSPSSSRARWLCRATPAGFPSRILTAAAAR